MLLPHIKLLCSHEEEVRNRYRSVQPPSLSRKLPTTPEREEDTKMHTSQSEKRHAKWVYSHDYLSRFKSIYRRHRPVQHYSVSPSGPNHTLWERKGMLKSLNNVLGDSLSSNCLHKNVSV